jgi:Sulfotransferase family
MQPDPYSKKNNFPNFLIIGALKSGTNSLSHYLQAHPQVFMCPWNEPSFFAHEDLKNLDSEWVRTNAISRLEDYLALFDGVKDETAIGEASPMYLVSPSVPQQIKQTLSDVRLVAILRNPVDRAYSQWQMELRNTTESITDFARATQTMQTLPDGSVRQRFIYGGKYYALLKPYYDLFGAARICVLLHDELNAAPESLLKKLYSFLDVDSAYLPPDIYTRYNEGGLPRSRGFYRNIYPLLTRLNTSLPPGMRSMLKGSSRKVKQQFLVKPPKLSSELRAELNGLFTDDILRLQDLIQQDLGSWLKNGVKE